MGLSIQILGGQDCLSSVSVSPNRAWCTSCGTPFDASQLMHSQREEIDNRVEDLIRQFIKGGRYCVK
jgi:hypothetical protein